MASKLDYLKKYGMPGDDGDGKKKKRRKKVSSKSGQDVEKVRSGGGGLRIIDDEADMALFDTKKIDKAWEGEETEEEKPTLVVEDSQDGKKIQSGSWTTVGDVDHSSNGNDMSPPRRRKRHDSSDEDASPPRRNPRHNNNSDDAQDASPPRRRRPRDDDSPVDASPPRKPRSRRGHDDGGRGDDERKSGGQRGGDGSDASLPRRRRGQGREEGGGRGGGGGGGDDRDPSPPRRRRTRHDSSDDDDDGDASPPRRKDSSRGRRHGGGNGDSDASPPRRRRQESGGRGDDDASPPRKPKGGRGSGGGNRARDGGIDPSPPRRRPRESRQEGEEGQTQSRRRRQGSPGNGEGGGRGGDGGGDRVKTSSGYYAGLQSGKDFKAVEKKLKRKHEEEMKGADTKSSGQDAQTVYRDKKGRKLDMLNEFMKQQDSRAGKEVEDAKEQFAWGRGKVQKAEETQLKEELDNIAAEPFARTIDDTRLEDARKAEMRPDDPMASYMKKKKTKERIKSGKPAKPEYKGPAPKPNRFGIRPGYRWDGNDRGNGWEDKIVAKGVDNSYKADLAYKWASADM